MKQANYTREWVVEQLIENVLLAKAAEDFGSANTALKMLGVERQMFIDRRETGDPGAFATQSEADVMDLVQRELGADAAAALAKALGQMSGDERGNGAPAHHLDEPDPLPPPMPTNEGSSTPN